MEKLLEYYQPAFELLNRDYGKQAGREAMLEARNFQTTSLASILGENRNPSPNEAWEAGFTTLGKIEDKLKSILERHSAFYWLHLYRRTGCYLNRLKGEQDDAITVWLVREILELAIQKYSRLQEQNDFGSVQEYPLGKVLGGWMEKGAEFYATLNADFECRIFLDRHKTFEQVVLIDFDENDYIDIFRAQAYAYEYWRITALLRASGKGASVEVIKDGSWQYCVPADFWWLVESFDSRNAQFKNSANKLGNWAYFDDSQKFELNESLIFPALNTDRRESERFGIPTNFQLSGYSFEYAKILNQTLQDRIFKECGFSFEDLFLTLWGLSTFAIAPTRVRYAKTKEEAEVYRESAYYHLQQRGYFNFGGTLDRLAETLQDIAHWGELENYPDQGILLKVLKFISLEAENQMDTNLWTRGPVRVLIPVSDGFVFNLAQIAPLLDGFTAKLRLSNAENDARGNQFEEQFRSALKNSNADVIHQDICHSSKKIGEIDAGIRVDNTLYLFECYSSSTPLDLEISKPVKLRQRTFGSSKNKSKDCLNNKLAQVCKLVKHLKKHPKGDNYDFSGINAIEPFVVSPFQEWIWERSKRLWFDENTPRILSADEAIAFVKGIGRKRCCPLV